MEKVKDTIYRQDAIDAMANTLWHYPNECYRNLNVYEFARGLAELGLKSVPSAQPEIIRCKDCKWYEGDIMANPWGVCCHDGWVGGHIGHEVSERGWCYRAERRTYG